MAAVNGLGPFSAQDYAELDLDEYRRKYPEETKRLKDEHIWHVVGTTEDDMSDDEWRAAFMEVTT